MRNVLLTLLFIGGLAGSAQARIGETADQLVARYGQPLSEDDQKKDGDKIALANVVFQKGGFEISVTITAGVSVQETYKKLNGSPILVDEARYLLTANAQGEEWSAPRTVEGDKIWTRDDGATATLAHDGTMTIRSAQLTHEETAAKRIEEHPSLEGF